MNKVFRRSLLGVAVSTALVLSGCATHSDKLGFAESEGTKTYAEAYEPARQMFQQGQWDQLREKLNSNASKEVTVEVKSEDGQVSQETKTEKLTNEEEKERLIKEQSELAIVERGLMTLNVGDFKRALFYFDAAEEKLGLAETDDTIGTKASSVGKSGLAMLIGAEEMANYEMRGYEKVMLLNYKALCYMLMGDRKAYNVTRRAIDLQQAEWEKFKQLLEENKAKQSELKDSADAQPKQELKEMTSSIEDQRKQILQSQLTMMENSRDQIDAQIKSGQLNAFQLIQMKQSLANLNKQIDQTRKMMAGATGPRADRVSIADVDDRTDEVKEKANMVSSAYVNPFGDYLNAMMMEIDGFDDSTMRQNAKIAYKKVLENNKDCVAAKQAVKDVEKGLKKNQKLVQIILSDGFSPYQLEKTKTFPIPLKDRVVNAVVNYSNATPVPTLTQSARISVNGKTTKLSSLTKMESLILRDEADRLPMRATMFGLAILRSAASGAYLGNLGSALAASMQHPDTRSWLSLPNQVYVARIAVPKNQKTLKLETLDEKGAVLTKQDVKLATDGPTVVYAVSFDKNMQVYANAFSWVD